MFISPYMIENTPEGEFLLMWFALQPFVESREMRWVTFSLCLAGAIGCGVNTGDDPGPEEMERRIEQLLAEE